MCGVRGARQQHLSPTGPCDASWTVFWKVPSAGARTVGPLFPRFSPVRCVRRTVPTVPGQRAPRAQPSADSWPVLACLGLSTAMPSSAWTSAPRSPPSDTEPSHPAACVEGTVCCSGTQGLGVPRVCRAVVAPAWQMAWAMDTALRTPGLWLCPLGDVRKLFPSSADLATQAARVQVCVLRAV